MVHDDVVFSIEFSRDGKKVVTASRDGTARVWDAKSGKPLIEPLRHYGITGYAEFSLDGKRVATAGVAAQIWDAETGKPLIPPIENGAGFWAARFSPDGQKLLTVEFKRHTARVWNAHTGQLLAESPKFR